MATSPTLHRWLTRLRNYAIMDDTMDDDETPIPPSTPDTRGSGNPFFPFGRSASLRIETVQPTRLMIRRAIRTFEEASDAVEALRDGQAQIINLDNIPIEMANRIVDFIAGATYALDGTVEKIGEQVYLFTPPSFQIEHDDHLVQFQKRVLNRPKIDWLLLDNLGIEYGRSALTSGNSVPVPDDKIVQLLRQNKKIEAIKLYRQQTGLGLKEAKDAVDEIDRNR